MMVYSDVRNDPWGAAMMVGLSETFLLLYVEAMLTYAPREESMLIVLMTLERIMLALPFLECVSFCEPPEQETC